jgi:hypothetical protein
LKVLKIGLPELPFLNYLYISFLKLIDLDKANIRMIDRGVEIESIGSNVINVVEDALKYALELAGDHQKRGLRSEFPLSGNDSRWIKPKLLKRFGLPQDATMVDIINNYVGYLKSGNVNELQEHLYPYKPEGEYSPFQAFLLDLYALTRAPFFNGYYEYELKMNIHQMIICIAGYLAARHCITRIGDDQVAVLIFPLSLTITRYDFYRNIRNSLSNLPSIKPEEAAILWLVFHIPEDFPEDVLILGIKEPQGQQPVSLMTSIPVHLMELRMRASRGISCLKRVKGVERLLGYSLARRKRAGLEIDDATEYVKLLYLAIQEGYVKERLELALRASRREVMLTLSRDEVAKRRRYLASIAREVAKELLGLD